MRARYGGLAVLLSLGLIAQAQADCELTGFGQYQTTTIPLGSEVIPANAGISFSFSQPTTTSKAVNVTAEFYLDLLNLDYYLYKYIESKNSLLPNDDCDVKAFWNGAKIGVVGNNLQIDDYVRVEAWECAIGKNILGKGYVHVALVAQPTISADKLQLVTSSSHDEHVNFSVEILRGFFDHTLNARTSDEVENIIAQLKGTFDKQLRDLTDKFDNLQSENPDDNARLQKILKQYRVGPMIDPKFSNPPTFAQTTRLSFVRTGQLEKPEACLLQKARIGAYLDDLLDRALRKE